MRTELQHKGQCSTLTFGNMPSPTQIEEEDGEGPQDLRRPGGSTSEAGQEEAMALERCLAERWVGTMICKGLVYVATVPSF